jgi:hypothetical protein
MSLEVMKSIQPSVTCSIRQKTTMSVARSKLLIDSCTTIMSICDVSTPPSSSLLLTRPDSPAELRSHFDKLGWSRVVAFQTRHDN